MSATIPLFILLLLVHLGIFVTSTRRDRLRRLLLACAIIILCVPALWFAMSLPDRHGVLRGILEFSPLILALLAFLVYLRPRI